MTICIAAISNKDKIVAITDRMITLVGSATTTYEINENNKAISLNDTVIALFAGDVIQANEILRKAKDELDKNPSTTTKEIAEAVNMAFTNHWEEVINNFLMRRFKIGFQQFMHNQSAFDPDLVKQISQFISQFKIDVEIIVAGKHGVEKEAHIYVMDNMGTVVCQDAIGYACIGSGARHATFSLIETETNGSHLLEATLYHLLKAKKRAEYDPGVGKLCDVVILDKATKRCSQKDVEKVLQIFNKSVVKHREFDDKVIVELKGAI